MNNEKQRSWKPSTNSVNVGNVKVAAAWSSMPVKDDLRLCRRSRRATALQQVAAGGIGDTSALQPVDIGHCGTDAWSSRNGCRLRRKRRRSQIIGGCRRRLLNHGVQS